MSRIGKVPIEIPNDVTITISGQTVTVKGPKGELTHTVNDEITVKQEENQLVLSKKVDTANARAFFGLNRSLLANMIEGVTKGFEKKLEINGVGYRANAKGKVLELSLGYSHPINYSVPEGITVEQDKENKSVLIVSGIDKQQVGQVAAEIRAYRKPEPYKGKGIKYIDEHIRRKAGKAGAKD